MSAFDIFSTFLKKAYGISLDKSRPDPKSSCKYCKWGASHSGPVHAANMKKAAPLGTKYRPQGGRLGGPIRIYPGENPPAESSPAEVSRQAKYNASMKVKKGGPGSGRHPKFGTPPTLRTAIGEYEKKPTPPSHSRMVEAFRHHEAREKKPSEFDPERAPWEKVEHPWDSQPTWWKRRK